MEVEREIGKEIVEKMKPLEKEICTEICTGICTGICTEICMEIGMVIGRAIVLVKVLVLEKENGLVLKVRKEFVEVIVVAILGLNEKEEMARGLLLQLKSTLRERWGKGKKKERSGGQLSFFEVFLHRH